MREKNLLYFNTLYFLLSYVAESHPQCVSTTQAHSPATRYLLSRLCKIPFPFLPHQIIFQPLYSFSDLTGLFLTEFLKHTDTRTNVRAIFFRICAKFGLLNAGLAKQALFHIFCTILQCFIA